MFSPSKRSPARTASLPPRPSRPLVLRRELAQPAQDAAETYSVAGVNYTTYTTFRSPITPDQCDSVSSKQFPSEGEGGGETPTTPTNTPHIPEPDYDLRYFTSGQHVFIFLHCIYCSDGEKESCSGSESSWREAGGATLRRNQRLERKKKKTVSFIMNEELANIIHSRYCTTMYLYWTVLLCLQRNDDKERLDTEGAEPRAGH